MSLTSSSSPGPKNKRPLGALPPGFIPQALYVAIVEKALPPVDQDHHSPPAIWEALQLFYQENATTTPIGSSLDRKTTDVSYWSLSPSKQPEKGTMVKYYATCNMDVLGYVRVADFVAPRFLAAVVQADDRKAPSREPMSSGIYVFNALERLRRHAVFEANMGAWSLENFLVEINKFRHAFREEGCQKEWGLSRPFVDFPLVFHSGPAHWWGPRVVGQEVEECDEP